MDVSMLGKRPIPFQKRMNLELTSLFYSVSRHFAAAGSAENLANAVSNVWIAASKHIRREDRSSRREDGVRRRSGGLFGKGKDGQAQTRNGIPFSNVCYHIFFIACC